MSVRHSPSKECCVSEPDLSTITDSIQRNITYRHDKRKRGDVIEDELKTFMDQMKTLLSQNIRDQDLKFETLHTTMKEIQQQNTEISKSLAFMSEKYEEMRRELEKSETARKKNLIYINELEARISNLEKTSRNTSIEIRNVPRKTPETKEDILSLVKNIGSAINVCIEPNDIKDLFRYETKSSGMPIVVELSTVIKKEAIIEASKEYRRTTKSNLTTKSINLPMNPPAPVFISESLSQTTKILYAKSRKFASENSYQYCWTKHGNIFLRKNNGAKVLRINKDEDLLNLAQSTMK